VASLFYDKFWDATANGTVIPGVDTFYMMLLVPGFVPNKSTQAFRADVIASEIASSGGYSAGGMQVIVTPIAASAGNGNVESYSFADVVWAAATFTAGWGVVYKHRGGLATADELVCAIDFGGSQTGGGSTFTVHMVNQFGVQN
jgi:hypothetical protein